MFGLYFKFLKVSISYLNKREYFDGLDVINKKLEKFINDYSKETQDFDETNKELKIVLEH
jgi:hypothetical protein